MRRPRRRHVNRKAGISCGHGNGTSSYSHAGEALGDKLEEYLSCLNHQGLVESWHDRCVIAGSNIDAEISENLEKPDAILLPVMSSSIASAYCCCRNDASNGASSER